MVQVHVPRTGRHSRMNESPLKVGLEKCPLKCGSARSNPEMCGNCSDTHMIGCPDKGSQMRGTARSANSKFSPVLVFIASLTTSQFCLFSSTAPKVFISIVSTCSVGSESAVFSQFVM